MPLMPLCSAVVPWPGTRTPASWLQIICSQGPLHQSWAPSAPPAQTTRQRCLVLSPRGLFPAQRRGSMAEGGQTLPLGVEPDPGPGHLAPRELCRVPRPRAQPHGAIPCLLAHASFTLSSIPVCWARDPCPPKWGLAGGGGWAHADNVPSTGRKSWINSRSFAGNSAQRLGCRGPCPPPHTAPTSSQAWPG